MHGLFGDLDADLSVALDNWPGVSLIAGSRDFRSG